MRSRWLAMASLLCGLVATCTGRVQAHALLDEPAPRDQKDGYKDGSACGVSFDASQPVTSYAPGQMLNVQWLETVDHPGCFLVEFSPGADQGFQVIGRKSHSNQPPPEYATSAEPRHWSLDVTLPSTACTSCTLRLRQLMLDADVAADACTDVGAAPGSIYTTCANIRLGSGGASGAAAVAPSGVDNGGCNLGPRRGNAIMFAAVVVVGALRRRRVTS